MAQRRKPAVESVDVEFIDRADQAGGWIRHLRWEQGLSLRQLEAMAGVSASEIFRVENGSAPCRLDTFILLCAALGVPAGSMLDLLISSNFSWFNKTVLADVEFRAVADGLKVKDERARDRFALCLANSCAWAAILLRCAAPLQRAQFVDYPNADVKRRFLEFAGRVAALDKVLDRAAIIRALKQMPVATLRDQGLFSGQYCTDLWTPWVVRFEHLDGHPPTKEKKNNG